MCAKNIANLIMEKDKNKVSNIAFRIAAKYVKRIDGIGYSEWVDEVIECAEWVDDVIKHYKNLKRKRK